MTPKHLCLLLLALVAISIGAAQNEDELQIPDENDNQFPPDKHSDVIDGSGDGVIEEPQESNLEPTEPSLPPPLESIHTNLVLDETVATSSDDNLCPKPCVCRIEGTSNDFIVDCSGYDLTDFPTSINEDATVLLLQKNKLKEIPKDISTLKKLKTLNADDNLIMNLAPGSVSELPALVTLKLRNNKLIEYPNDLKNSFGLTELEELDLSGNDMRTEFSADVFSKFEKLHTIILPSYTEELNQNLCDALPKLLKVCSESCENQLFECQADGRSLEDLPVIPGMIPLDTADKEITGPEGNTPKENTEVNEKTESKAAISDASPTDSSPKNKEFSFRSAVNKQPSDVVHDDPIDVAPKDSSTGTEAPESPIQVGAKTTETNTGGVDKSIVGLVVAGMVVIVAGITIKKNWSSIRKRFSSNSQTPNERNGTSANGNTPEEVPLQNKSPV